MWALGWWLVLNAWGAQANDAFSGKWLGVDRDGWTYDLRLKTSGKFTQKITQGSPGEMCVQKGTLFIQDDQMRFVYRKNSCNREYEGRETLSPILHSDAGSFEVDMESYTVVYRRR